MHLLLRFGVRSTRRTRWIAYRGERSRAFEVEIMDGDGAPLLHDVGTLGPGSGQRLGGTLTGIDTPTLHGVWRTGPYLHDGSAATLREVLVDRNPSDQHGTTSTLSTSEIDDLVAYLLCLDGRRD